MKKFLIFFSLALTTQSFARNSYTFLTLKNPKPFKLTLTAIPSRGHEEHFTAKIKENGKLRESFNKCIGELLPTPERGIYRIYCHNNKSSLSVSGHFSEKENFTALWKKEDGSYQRLTSHKEI